MVREEPKERKLNSGMNESDGGYGGGGEEWERSSLFSSEGYNGTQWRWWAGASGVQLGWGIASFRKGYRGGGVSANMMPLKAFAVASLFVGAVASATISALHASGIHKVSSFY